MPFTGKDLIDMGYTQANWFGEAITAANKAEAERGDITAAIEAVRLAHEEQFAVKVNPNPMVPHTVGAIPYHFNLRVESPDELDNVNAVHAHMTELMKTPVITAGAIMPDACPAGSLPGTIPVGGVVASKGIHPGFHSADICCSLAMSVLPHHSMDAKEVLDRAMQLSHFGPGGRPRGAQFNPTSELMERFTKNPFLFGLERDAKEHFMTQGDGNHFFYVGTINDRVAIVTHHGSRKPGAMLYKRGMITAEKHTTWVSPETPKHNAWLDPETVDGQNYWEALQIIREWTKQNHFGIHDLVMGGIKPDHRQWNEHNFVFRKTDGLFYHGKGATPAFADYADDADEYTLIPLNMAEPILLVRGKDASNGLGFAPHGAGRNFSRTRFLKGYSDQEHTPELFGLPKHIDARAFSGRPDYSEYPHAYKNAAQVRDQIKHFGLAEVVNTIQPYGCIMAGENDWQYGRRMKKKTP